MGVGMLQAREREDHRASPAITSDEAFFPTNKRVDLKCLAIKMNQVMLTEGPRDHSSWTPRSFPSLSE